MSRTRSAELNKIVRGLLFIACAIAPFGANAAVDTKAACVAAGGHCVTGAGCNGSAPAFESALGTCEGGVGCCKKDPSLEAAAKRVTRTAAPTDLSVVDPLRGADIPVVIGRVIATFLGLVGAISLLVFVYAGVRYLTAGGSDEAVKTATDTMKYAFIGLVIILFAYAITNFFFQALLK